MLQDLNYTYDAVGNITRIKDDALQTAYFDNSVIYAAQQFTYDAIYRLIQASGREHLSIAPQWDEFINVQQVHKGDATAISNYTESYSYDEVGNITLQHHVGSTTWTRTFEYYSETNRLAKSYTGSTPPSFSYEYDEHGNMLAMEHLDTMSWNVLDQLQSVVVSGSETAYYHYGADGQRKRKTITNSSSKKERFYLDATEIYTEVNSLNVVTFSRESLHLMDDTRRIVLVDFPASVGSTTMTAPLIRYQYSNHIESAALELDDSGNVISYEEFYAFGGTSYYAVESSIEVPSKRYRYSAKERDEETGLYYFGARYHAPWLGRFISVDPKALEYVHQSSYVFADNDPVGKVDVNGAGGVYTDNDALAQIENEDGKVNPKVHDFSYSMGENSEETASSFKDWELEQQVKLSEVVITPQPLSEDAIDRIGVDAVSNMLPYLNISFLLPDRFIITGDLSQTILGDTDFEEKVIQETARLTKFALRGEASSLSELLLLSRYQRNIVDIVGDYVIELIKQDPSFQSFEQNALAEFKNGVTTPIKSGLELGGARGSLIGYALNPLDPDREKTRNTILNPLTWMLRHADIMATPIYKDGELEVEYYITDILDLTPHKGQTSYNMVVIPLDLIYRGLLVNSYPRVRVLFNTQY